MKKQKRKANWQEDNSNSKIVKNENEVKIVSYLRKSPHMTFTNTGADIHTRTHTCTNTYARAHTHRFYFSYFDLLGNSFLFFFFT